MLKLISIPTTKPSMSKSCFAVQSTAEDSQNPASGKHHLSGKDTEASSIWEGKEAMLHPYLGQLQSHPGWSG